ncbi:hypothetical protein HNR46_001901 [Haloferula luteola]|uniref:PEP-CTERM protein-sorting domain-containing protein n=1 Tax=Haloferula luteola TaxID=595692 RepID=A0A840V0Z2_9BACT|nr:PEP-CTERM sorting domain-containing protein [Haloferula luteola]MBB5351662.1 hypothetical protein [Haloferula luteola]
MKPILRAMWLLSAASVAPLHAATVFADDFSETDGTEISGKAPDVGSAWTGTAPTIVAGTYDSTGAGRGTFGNFTVALGAGQVLTLTYDSMVPNGGAFFTTGWAGVSLYAGGSERLFTGDSGVDTIWSVDQAAVLGLNLSSPGDSTEITSVTLQYYYDTGAWAFSTTSGVNLSGTGLAFEAFDQIRIANGSGGDIRIDNLNVDISAVPEPSASLFAGLSVLGLGFLRRRA